MLATRIRQKDGGFHFAADRAEEPPEEDEVGWTPRELARPIGLR